MRVDLTGGHRLLVFGSSTRVKSSAIRRVWPRGALPPRILDERTVVVGAAGAATGLGALMDARTVIPAGATGLPGSDLAAKRRAAKAAIARGAGRVIVRVGGADAAGQDRDRDAKIGVLEAADRDVVGPLVDEVAERGGTLEVCADHRCDPSTGEHLGGPIPRIRWSPR
jgi:2,3-bisphosphoglycerate-independent phosphoglycerate mutase